jgi:hypothetical protein
METRLDADKRADILALMRAYRIVAERFSDDLSEARDVALARSAALMLIQHMAKL